MAIFSNCIIQAPDGVALSRCSIKKAKWYLKKDLADVIETDPMVIRLRFEPSGRSGLEDPLMLEGKPNICVVCGTNQNLTKHHIIPYSFIKHMDLKYKVDIIRDIYPLCEPCHQEYEKFSNERRKKMADALNLPLHGLLPDEARKVRKATASAFALVEHKDKIPLKRQEELRQIVRSFLEKPKLTEEDLVAVRDYDICGRADFVNFSKLVAETVDDYNEFAKGWRIHFVETMKPKFMPAIWKVDRKSDNVWIPQKMLRDHNK